jgi:hypothetical protein
MKSASNGSRVLGVAFLLQFVTSFSSGVFLRQALVVPDNIRETMLKIADNAWLMRATILVDMLTALGVIFLGAMLYLTLRRQNESMVLVAMGFYLLEAVLLAGSRMEAFSLLRISQDYVAAGQSGSLLTLGTIAFESMDFLGSTLAILAFCPGAILFYYPLYKSGIVPHGLSLWGLITVLPILIGTIAQIFGTSIPFAFYVPYVPFEFVIGVWIVVKGIRVEGLPDGVQ